MPSLTDLAWTRTTATAASGGAVKGKAKRPKPDPEVRKTAAYCLLGVSVLLGFGAPSWMVALILAALMYSSPPAHTLLHLLAAKLLDLADDPGKVAEFTL